MLADNQAVCSVSVIYYQIKEPEKVIRLLSQKLAISEKEVRKKVEKISSREKIKSNVPKAIADEIREAGLSGVKVDEDYKRYYPFGTLASKVLGFAGADNQGILGLESRYDSTLKGTDGKILTMTDYQGIEVENLAEDRIEPVSGDDLYLSLDYNIQCYVQQAAKKVLKAKKAKRVSAILMNPQNGEIYALVSLPEYDLNEPFTLIEEYKEQGKTQNDKLNNMWRNPVISDSYEPGSTFKIVTATAALEEKKVTLQDSFFCSGFKLVEDRKIRCHKTQGHGAETFQQGFMNSCNPVFMEIGARVGAKDMLKYYQKLGLYERTGVDLPGEANSIMHKLSKIGAVELATMSFGQSIQITPLQLLRAVSAGINGGKLVIPHLAMEKKDSITKEIIQYEYPIKPGAVSEETSQTLRELLEAVVAEGTGKNGQVEGYRVGGKTATSEKLPRRSGKYISSFLGFAPADSPKILGLVLIDEPQGVYYGGVIAAPHTQSTVDEATEHLNAVIKALVKAETKEETKTDVTKLNAVIEKAEALKQSDYTAESWKNLQTALDAAKKLTDATAEQTVVDQAASDLETAILALVKADTENTGTTDKKKKPAVGTVKTVGQIKYKVTGKNTVTVNKYAKKNITKASIPATVKINGYTFKVTAIADSAFSGCSKLTKVTVGSNVKAIGNKSFYKCTKLTTFTASSTGLNKIGKEAFSGDKKLANITLKTTKLKKSGVGKDAFKNIKKNATFKVPAKKVSDYKAIFKSKGAGKNIKIKKL